MRARVTVFVLLFLVFGFLAMSTSIRSAKPAINEADAQASSPAATPTPAFNVTSVGLIAFRASPGGTGNTNGAVLVVTSNATEQSSINFYYQCAPTTNLGKLGTCPTDGILVFSAPICTLPTMVSDVLTCPTAP